MSIEEKSPLGLLNVLEKANQLVNACRHLFIADLAEIPHDMLRESAQTASSIRNVSRKICEALNLQIAKDKLAAKEALERETPKRLTETTAADPERWVHDSWIAECEAAGVYSRQPPVFRYAEDPILAVTLTRSELWMLAQRHLNTVVNNNESVAWTGECEKFDGLRAKLHEQRFWQLFELLPTEDQKRFEQQIEIRTRYLESVRAEVARISEEEEAFQNRVEAGLASEAEIAAHVTHPLVMGLPVMPAPADGGPGPEDWNMNGTSYHENPFSDLAYDPHENA